MARPSPLQLLKHTTLASAGLYAAALTLAGCGPAGIEKVSSPAQFQTKVLNASQPVMVTFTADNCPACTYQRPHFQKVAEEYWWRADFVKVNLDEAPALGNTYQVRSVPTVLFFRRGQAVGEPLVGAFQAVTYRQALKAILQGRDFRIRQP